jgi:hypothetical protein
VWQLHKRAGGGTSVARIIASYTHAPRAAVVAPDGPGTVAGAGGARGQHTPPTR